MHLLYGATTVNIDDIVLGRKWSEPDGNTEAHKTLTGKTVAVYANGPIREQVTLSCKMDKAKMIELDSFWSLVNGAEKAFTFRDFDNTDYSVKWVDEVFPINKNDYNRAEGTITLEKV